MFVSPDPIASVIIVAGVFIYYALKSVGKWMGDIPAAKGEQDMSEKLFLDLNVNPVSEGDCVCYAIRHEGRFTALVENKAKRAKLTLEADSIQELQQKVEETFRAWAVTGKKRR